jgi:hypothetical protein
VLAVSFLPFDDVEQLFLILWGLYAVECAWWLRGNARRIYGDPLADFSDDPLDGPQVDTWRLGFSNPLPWCDSYTAESHPFPFDGTRFLLPETDPANGMERYRAVAFDTIGPVTASDRSVLCDGLEFGQFSAPVFAQAVATRLERVRCAPPHERCRVAEDTIERAWDFSAAKNRLAHWRQVSRTARRLGGALAILVLALAPAAWILRTRLPQDVLIVMACTCIVLWLAAAIAGCRVSPSGLHGAMPFLSPATAMRLYDTLGRDSLLEFEPLVVALATASGRRRSGIAAYLRDAINPMRPSGHYDDAAGSDTSTETLEWFRAKTARCARQAVEDAGLCVDELLEQVADSDRSLSYCPRCARQFVQAIGQCEWCSLSLKPFEPRPKCGGEPR